MKGLTIPLGTWDIQALAEATAALELGNLELQSTAARRLRAIFEQALKQNKEHFLFLRDSDDLGSFFGCGPARGAVDTMVEDGQVCRLYAIPKNECSSCKEEEEQDPYAGL